MCKIGDRIRFRKILEEGPTGDHPALLFANKNDMGEIIKFSRSHGPYDEKDEIDVAEVLDKSNQGLRQAVVSKEIVLIPSFEEAETFLCEHCAKSHLLLTKCATWCAYCKNTEVGS